MGTTKVVEIWSSSSSWETVFETKTEQGITQTECIVYKRGYIRGIPFPRFCSDNSNFGVPEKVSGSHQLTIEGNTKLTQLFYMDDLEVYAKGEKALGRMVKAVEGISAAVGMAFGLNKCATSSMSGGKVKSVQHPWR